MKKPKKKQTKASKIKAILEAAKNNDSMAIYKLNEQLRITYLDIVGYESNISKITGENGESNQIIEWACANGSLEALEAISSIVPLNESDFTADYCEPIKCAMYNRHIHILDWIKDNFYITASDLHASDSEAYRYAKAQGFNDVTQWVDQFEINEDDN